MGLGKAGDFFKNLSLDDPKVKIAIVIVLVVVLVLFLRWRNSKTNKKSTTEKVSGNKSKKKKSGKENANSTRTKDSGGGKSNAGLGGRISGFLGNPFGGNSEKTSNNEAEENEDDSSLDGQIDEELREDAQELFDLVHEGLAKDMDKDEFSNLVGDLADSYTYIQLKQLYNDRISRNMNPLRTITVTDYIKILRDEETEDAI